MRAAAGSVPDVAQSYWHPFADMAAIAAGGELGAVVGSPFAAAQVTFDQPGTYSYYCAIHPATMRGRVQESGPA